MKAYEVSFKAHTILANHPELFPEYCESHSLKIYSLFVLEVNGVCLRGCLNFLSGSTGFIALTTLVVILFVPVLRNTAPIYF